MLSESLWQSAVALESFLRSQGFLHCFIGGVALQRWGEPRTTRDLDITLLSGFGNEGPVIDAILREFDARIDDAASFAKLNRILLVEDERHTPIDVSLGAMPFEERTIERSSSFKGPGDGRITTCSAEDLVVHKAFADRDQDWIDVRSILVRFGDTIDKDLIWNEITPLAELKESPQILTRLKQLMNAVNE